MDGGGGDKGMKRRGRGIVPLVVRGGLGGERMEEDWHYTKINESREERGDEGEARGERRGKGDEGRREEDWH